MEYHASDKEQTLFDEVSKLPARHGQSFVK